MEKDTFTLAEVMGISFWEATWPMLVIITIIILATCGDLLLAICQVKYHESWLQRRVQRIRWKIAAIICPEMEHMADDSVDLKNQIDGIKMDAEQDHYWSIN